jgi:hypothetical protein
MVSFGNDSSGMPKKVLLWLLIFYEHHFTDALGNVTNEIRAIIQMCNWQVGTAQHRQEQMEETNLCSCWQISMKHVSWQGLQVNIPDLYAIRVADIHESVLVFEEQPSLCESWDGERHIWLVKDQCKKWCHMFPLQDI